MSFLRAILRGLGSILCIAPRVQMPKLGSLEDDWWAVGEDLRNSVEDLRRRSERLKEQARRDVEDLNAGRP